MSMTPQAGIDLLRQRLGGRTPSNQLGQHLIAELNAAQLEYEGRPPYLFFLESYASGILPSTTFDGFEVPSDYITEHEERPMTWTSDAGQKYDLEKRMFEELVQDFDLDGDVPKYYAIVGGTDVYTFPHVSTGTYSLRYYANIAPISASTLSTINKWWRFAPFLLIAKAGFTYAANTLKDGELAQAFQLELTAAEQALLALNTQQSMAKFDAAALQLKVRNNGD